MFLLSQDQNPATDLVELHLEFFSLFLFLEALTHISPFGGMISAISYFKPQSVSVSTVSLAVITYVLSELMAFVIPERGIIGRQLIPTHSM